MKKQISLVVFILLLCVLIGTMVSCYGPEEKTFVITKKWPETEFTEALPKPNSDKQLYVAEFESGNRIVVRYESTLEESIAYIDEVRKTDLQFVKSKKDKDNSFTYVTFKKGNKSVIISYSDTIMDIDIVFDRPVQKK